MKQILVRCDLPIRKIARDKLMDACAMKGLKIQHYQELLRPETIGLFSSFVQIAVYEYDYEQG